MIGQHGSQCQWPSGRGATSLVGFSCGLVEQYELSIDARVKQRVIFRAFTWVQAEEWRSDVVIGPRIHGVLLLRLTFSTSRAHSAIRCMLLSDANASVLDAYGSWDPFGFFPSCWASPMRMPSGPRM